MTILHVERVGEIVQAGLSVHGHAERAHASDDVDLLGRRDVDDVERTPGDAADLAGRLASDETRDVGSAFPPGCQVGASRALEVLLKAGADIGVLGMDHREHVGSIPAERRQPIEALVQHPVVGVADRDLVGRGVLPGLVCGVEVLEADDTALREFLLFIEVAVGLHDRVEGEVAVRNLIGPGDLLLEPGDVLVAHRDRRATLEADDGCDALVSRAAALALPAGAEPVDGGIGGAYSDVGVGVDQPRQDPVAVGVDALGVRRERAVRAYPGDDAVLGEHTASHDSRWGDDVAILDDQAHDAAPSLADRPGRPLLTRSGPLRGLPPAAGRCRSAAERRCTA